MSAWKEAIADVINDLREEAQDYVNDLEKETPQQATHLSYMAKLLKGYAKRLEGICKAAGDPLPVQPMGLISQGVTAGLISPTIQHVAEVEKYRSEFKKHKSGASTEERYSGDMVVIIGGPAAPDDQVSYHPVDPGMPFGAYALLAGGVYRLEMGDNSQKQLVYDEEQTRAASVQHKNKPDSKSEAEQKSNIILG